MFLVEGVAQVLLVEMLTHIKLVMVAQEYAQP
jgi:hypothetical protein